MIYGPFSGEGGGVAVKLGVVYLGNIGGKDKYTLLEEDDIDFVRRFTLEAKLEVDRDGRGAKVFAVAQTEDSETGGPITQYFHNMLWLNHFRSIPDGCMVVHKNGITVDNRLVNLELVEVDPVTRLPAQRPLSAEERDHRARGGDLYKLALSRLPSFENHPLRKNVWVDADGMEVTDNEANPFYECRNPSCCTFEEYPGCFAHHCDKLRYCSDACLQADNKRLRREQDPEPRAAAAGLASR
mmetsp:Transcript_18324/g.47891  ORF Transcript_18324/g.47891 Transcript_18324/m.47891 type:complete len:241 (+) Transcript_18324:24-746(+)